MAKLSNWNPLVSQKMTKIKHINSLTSAKNFAKIKQIQILTHTAALYWLSISTPYMYETFPGSYEDPWAQVIQINVNEKWYSKLDYLIEKYLWFVNLIFF